MVSGINHITLSVRDLDKSLPFYVEILGCKLTAKWNKGAYLRAGNLWLCLLVDVNTRKHPLSEYTHIAFQVAQEDFASLSVAIKKSGAKIWQTNESEGDSLYFLDPDNHKLEIHVTTLDDRLDSCKEAPFEEMMFY